MRTGRENNHQRRGWRSSGGYRRNRVHWFLVLEAGDDPSTEAPLQSPLTRETFMFHGPLSWCNDSGCARNVLIECKSMHCWGFCQKNLNHRNTSDTSCCSDKYSRRAHGKRKPRHRWHSVAIWGSLRTKSAVKYSSEGKKIPDYVGIKSLNPQVSIVLSVCGMRGGE